MRGVEKTITVKKGDHVWVRLRRGAGGAVAKRDDTSLPLTECVVAQVDVCGCPGIYGLEYADTRKPVGLPFSDKAFEAIDPRS